MVYWEKQLSEVKDHLWEAPEETHSSLWVGPAVIQRLLHVPKDLQEKLEDQVAVEEVLGASLEKGATEDADWQNFNGFDRTNSTLSKRKLLSLPHIQR
jgi:hypothetical protein